ncbi:hypothetical protein MM214_10540 [Belliella kenyensis]|uniref:type IX secretion system anionic LPS delivery protein PorZ n=1 Tax=Belliella kenyensis TaxID=1472724 RepID=UPI0025B2C126|nr:hypothetical protein [Belliella kenyensis]MCH7402295.1 hypothetical protein [Belliella kenyensis]MDN3603486.1 hypothetical protein [Belliella kenyensis]
MQLKISPIILKVLMKYPLWLCFWISGQTLSQSLIATGAWEIHNSYLDDGRLAGSDRTIFHQGRFGLFYFSVLEKKSFALTKSDGLYGNEFSTSAYEEANKRLILAYPDGMLDIIGEDRIRSLAALRDNEEIQTKSINKIKILSNAAYLAADFGVAVINTQNAQFIDVFLNIGPLGSTLKVLDISEDQQAFYLAGEMGIFKGLKSTNLKDFRNWQLVTNTEHIQATQIEHLDGKFYLRSVSGQLYLWEEQGLQEIFTLAPVEFIKRKDDMLFFKSGRSIFQIHSNGSYEEVFSWEKDFTDFHLAEKVFYIAQIGNGLIDTNIAEAYAPNGPITKIQAFASSGESTFALPVFRSIEGDLFTSESGQSSELLAGNWSPISSFEEIISIHSLSNKTYIATRSTGIWLLENGQVERLILPNVPNTTKIRLMEVDHLGQLWIGLEDNQARLLKITTDQQIIQVPIGNMSFPYKLIMDRRGNLYILQSNQIGVTSLTIFNESTGLNRSITSQSNMGGLPNSNIQDFAIDGEFRLWIASANGVFYIPNINSIQNNTAINAIQPLYNNLPLMNGESVRAIAISPDRSIWIGTASNGLFHFSEVGTVLISHFTRFNSPLHSNRIQNLYYKDLDGELFVVTPSGAISHKTGIVSPYNELQALKVYPNPVYPDFNGLLTIEGLTDYAEVRITTSAGRVVYSQQVAGGSITWNIRDSSGRRPVAGIYLIFAFDENGNERATGKVVVL